MLQRQTNKQKGFTLIEMVVVIAVIGILMGIAFQGFASIQQNARDTRRASDLRRMQVHLELYNARCFHYPTAGECNNPGTSQGTLNRQQLVSNLALIGVNEAEIPRDPIGTREYLYGFAPGGLSYVVAATMERQGPNRAVTGMVNGIDCNTHFCLRN